MLQKFQPVVLNLNTIKIEYYPVGHFNSITEFDMLQYLASTKGKAHMYIINMHIFDMSTKRIWALLLVET